MNGALFDKGQLEKRGNIRTLSMPPHGCPGNAHLPWEER